MIWGLSVLSLLLGALAVFSYITRLEMYYWNKYGEHKLHRLSDLSPEILIDICMVTFTYENNNKTAWG